MSSISTVPLRPNAPRGRSRRSSTAWKCRRLARPVRGSLSDRLHRPSMISCRNCAGVCPGAGRQPASRPTSAQAVSRRRSRRSTWEWVRLGQHRRDPEQMGKCTCALGLETGKWRVKTLLMPATMAARKTRPLRRPRHRTDPPRLPAPRQAEARSLGCSRRPLCSSPTWPPCASANGGQKRLHLRPARHPTTFILEERLCARSKVACSACWCSSGLAALANVALALLRQGDEVLIPDNAYGPNRP